MNDELKPCPFCGGEAVFTVSRVRCTRCGGEGRTEWLEKDAIAAWNRRTPEPGISVIHWQRYDGSPETLPEKRKDVLLASIEWKQLFYGCIEWLDGAPYWDLLRKGCIDPMIGDLWSPLPQPPEGME